MHVGSPDGQTAIAGPSGRDLRATFAWLGAAGGSAPGAQCWVRRRYSRRSSTAQPVDVIRYTPAASGANAAKATVMYGSTLLRPAVPACVGSMARATRASR